MPSPPRTVLITGCSDDGLGAALALAFRAAGAHVYATARNVSKMTQAAAAGCETLELDVTSADSIAKCVAQVPSLDILVNNAGAGYSMPVADMSIPEAKKVFDLNVWAPLAVTQAFLPVLRASKAEAGFAPVVANHTSVGSVWCIPFQSAYNASKAAMAMFNDAMRLELAAFGVRVVEIKTGGAKSQLLKNNLDHNANVLPEDSAYEPVREKVEAVLRGEWVQEHQQSSAEEWAKQVVGDLLRNNPPVTSWRGYGAGTVRMLTTVAPAGSLDGLLKKITTVDVIEKELRKGAE